MWYLPLCFVPISGPAAAACRAHYEIHGWRFCLDLGSWFQATNDLQYRIMSPREIEPLQIAGNSRSRPTTRWSVSDFGFGGSARTPNYDPKDPGHVVREQELAAWCPLQVIELGSID